MDRKRFNLLRTYEEHVTDQLGTRRYPRQTPAKGCRVFSFTP